MTKPEIPHVHFTLMRATVKENPLHDKRCLASVELSGTFVDTEAWEVIHTKLIEGVKIYVSEDFKGELMMAAQEELSGVQRDKSLLKIEVAKLSRQVAALQAELDKKNELLSVLDRQLQGLPSEDG